MAEFDIQRLRTQLLLQRRNLVIGVVLGAASVALLFFGAMPFWNRVRVVQADIVREETALARMQQRASLLSGITAEEIGRFATVGQALPLGKQPLIVLQTLESIAAEASVVLGKYDLNPGLISTEAAQVTGRASRAAQARSNQAQVMPLSVEMVGEFSEIQEAILLIEQSAPLMEVVEISLAPERQVEFSTPTTSYRANMLIQTYFAQLDARELARQGAAALTASQQGVLEMILGLQYRVAFTPQVGPPPDFNNPNIFGLGLSAEQVETPALEVPAETGAEPAPAEDVVEEDLEPETVEVVVEEAPVE